MANGPRVSVIIPVYNLREFVGAAIESALAQTLPAADVEVVVVDDGSTDGSGEVARRYTPRVRCLHHENRGLSATRNAGIRASRAPFLMFLDADDRILPEKLAAQVAVFAARPEVGLVYTGFRYIDVEGAPLPQRGWSRQEGNVFPQLVLGNLIHPHQALVRRADVERAGGFDERLTSAEDWDLWLRLSRPGLLWACVDRPLAEYRIRPGSMHQHPARMAENRLRVLDKVFAEPELSAEIVCLKPRAYERAHLVSAAEHYRAGERSAGVGWLHTAARARPTLLTEPDTLRLFCGWLLPLGYQGGAMMAWEWRRLCGMLRGALAELFATPDLDPRVARLRWRATVAAWRAVMPLVRRRMKAVVRRRTGTPP